MKPLAIDLFCGLGGWTDGLLAEGYNVVGFDIEVHHYGDAKYPAQLVIQDVMTLHGSQFKGAALIVASPPCQKFSYMAMPWSRAKNIAKEYRSGVRDVKQLTALFDACFRIQREASEAAGHHIPMVVENVRGAIPWVGRSRWNFGSFHLWGDVPALMPMVKPRAKVGGIDFNGYGQPGYKAQAFNSTAEQRLRHEALKTPPGNCSEPLWKNRPIARLSHPTPKEMEAHGFESMQTESVDRHVREGQKTSGHVNKRDGHSHTRHLTNDGVKQPGPGGAAWFDRGVFTHGSKSNARKAASAMIAKIPETLSRHIARAWKPEADGPRREPLGQMTFWKIRP